MATMVTGGTGFIGSNVIKALAQRGHEVVCFDLEPPDDLVKRYLEPWTGRVAFVQGDVLRMPDLERITSSGVTKIVHAAVFTGILPDIETGRSHSIVDINIMGTANVLELARRLPTDRFLYVSSGAVYGEREDPNDVLYEDGPTYPHTLYAVTKYASELLVRRYGQLHGFQTVSVRVGGPYGPMERVSGHRANQSIIKEWTGNAMRGEPIGVIDRTVAGQFAYVTDIAEGICTVLDAPSLSYEVYNNSSMQRNTLGDVIEAIRQLCPDFVAIDVSPSDASNEVATTLRGRQNRLGVTRLKDDVGFCGKFDLTTGLQDYMQWRETYHYTD